MNLGIRNPMSDKCGISAIIHRRLEAFWLDEWIEYHLSIGFDKVLIYDNGSNPVDNTEFAKGARPLTAEEEQKGVWVKKPDAEYFWDKTDADIENEMKRLKDKYEELTIEPWVMGENHLFEYPESQTESLKFTLATYPSMRWAFIDPDEFLILMEHATIKDLIEECGECGCIKFSERVYEKRERGKKALDITRWAYESALSKYLVLPPVQPRDDFNVHNAVSVKGKEVSVPIRTAYIKHCRGDPMSQGGILNQSTYEKLGKPEFLLRNDYLITNQNFTAYDLSKISTPTRKGIHTFIFSWKGYFKQAVKLEKELRKYSRVTVVNSDEKNTCRHWITLTDKDFFSRQMKTAMDLFKGEIMAHIQADCSYDKWEQVYERATEQILKNRNGIYAPNVSHTVLTSSQVDIRQAKDKSLSYVSFTDETAWFISREVLDKFEKYRYLFEQNTYGYGWDLFLASVSWMNAYPVIRDYNHTVKHPKGKGYSDRKAMQELRRMEMNAPKELSAVVYDIRNNRKKLFSKYILRDAKTRKNTKTLAVVLVATRRELLQGDVRRCLDAYFKTAKGTCKVDLKIFFNVGDEQEYEDLKRYEIYPSVNKVSIVSHNLSSLNDIYIRTPEEARARNVMPSLGASAGANNLFFDSMIPLMEEDYENYLMIETDSRPLTSKWIEGITEYIKGKKFLIAGSQYKGTQRLSDYETWTGHLNGIAVYKKSKKLKWLLTETKKFIEYQVKEKKEIFLSFDVAIHLFLSTRKGLKYIRSKNLLIDTPIITNMSLPCDADVDTSEVVEKYPKTIILHQKYK